MIGRIWTAYTVEVLKALRQWPPFAGPWLVALAVLAGLLARPIVRDGVADYGFVAYVAPLALNSLGFLVLLVYCAGLIATEMHDGSIRLLLVRPVRRVEFFLAKLFFAMTYALLLAVVAGGLAWLLPYVLGDLRGVHFGGELVFTDAEMAGAYAIGLALSVAPLFAGAAFALMFSALTRSTTLAAMASVCLWILADLAKYPLGIERYVFTTYLEAPWEVFANRTEGIDAAWFPAVPLCLATCGATFLVCTVLGVFVFGRRNFSQ